MPSTCCDDVTTEYDQSHNSKLLEYQYGRMWNMPKFGYKTSNNIFQRDDHALMGSVVISERTDTDKQWFKALHRRWSLYA